MRDDIEIKEYAERLGYEATVDKQGFWKPGVPNNPYSYVKGNVHVWKVRDGWRIARLVDGKFTDHVTRDDVTLALNTAETMVEPMGIQELEHTESRDEETAITCTHIDRGNNKQFVVARRSLVVPSVQSMIEFESVDELTDLRNILNEMIDKVQPEG